MCHLNGARPRVGSSHRITGKLGGHPVFGTRMNQGDYMNVATPSAVPWSAPELHLLAATSHAEAGEGSSITDGQCIDGVPFFSI